MTHDELKILFEYNPESGEFIRKVIYHRQAGTVGCNRVITSTNLHGYHTVGIRGKVHLVHRLVWLYMTGNEPDGQIDHIDGNKQNNRWSNLRVVSSVDNSRNRGVRKDNVSGATGVTRIKRSGKYVARIGSGQTYRHLGTFDTFDEALLVRKNAESIHGYHPNHGERPSWEK
jgi:hypothetical protein